MKTLELLEKMKKQVVFTSRILDIPGNSYANLYIHRLKKRKLIENIEKNLYTIYKDPFLIASRIVWPSYLSCWTGLKFHNLTEQIPYVIFVVIPYYKKAIKFRNTSIIFIATKSKNFFGYDKVNYQGFEIFVADREKSIIDSALFKKSSFSELIEIIESHLDELDLKKFVRYLKRIGNKSLMKRFGYLFDTMGMNFYPALKKYIDKVYIPLDYAKKKIGLKNKKWMVIQNAKQRRNK